MGSVAIPGFGGLGWVWEAVCSDSWFWRGFEEVGLGGGRGRSGGGPVRRSDATRREDETRGAQQPKLMHRVRGRWWEVGGKRWKFGGGGRRFEVIGR